MKKLAAAMLAAVLLVCMGTSALAAQETKTVEIGRNDPYTAIGKAVFGEYPDGFEISGISFSGGFLNISSNTYDIFPYLEGKDYSLTITAPDGWNLQSMTFGNYREGETPDANVGKSSDDGDGYGSWKAPTEDGVASVTFGAPVGGGYNSEFFTYPRTITIVLVRAPEPEPEPDPVPPKTGDATNVMLLGALLLMAAAGAVFFGRKCRQ